MRSSQALGTGMQQAQAPDTRSARQPLHHIGAGSPRTPQNLRDIEIKKDRPSILFQKHIGGLDVPVNHTLGMQIGQ